jgi:hypothetical protein
MFKYRKYSWSVFAFILMMSCSKRVITSGKENNYMPYSEILEIKKINITDSKLSSIICNFIDEVTIFENGVNSFSAYPLDYFIRVYSLCKNDSSLIVLNASAGSYLFYGHADDLDDRILEEYRLAEVGKKSVLISRDIEESFCKTKDLVILEDTLNKGEFELNWYQKSNGERLIYFYPYFFRIYNLTSEKIESVDLVFPDRIQELK